MKKSPEAERSGKTPMGSNLTEPEVDAALQLIQLSCDSAESGGDAAARTVEQSREESVGDSHEISSAVRIRDLIPLRRRKKRYRAIDDLYSATKPVIPKRSKKSRI